MQPNNSSANKPSGSAAPPPVKASNVLSRFENNELDKLYADCNLDSEWTSDVERSSRKQTDEDQFFGEHLKDLAKVIGGGEASLPSFAAVPPRPVPAAAASTLPSSTSSSKIEQKKMFVKQMFTNIACTVTVR